MIRFLVATAVAFLLTVQTADEKSVSQRCWRWVASQKIWPTIHSSVFLLGARAECMYTIYIPSGRKHVQMEL